MATTNWPLFDLEIRTADLTLRYPNDSDLMMLVDLAAEGVHDESFMPFSIPWTRIPVPDLQRKALQFHWQCRAETSPTNFRLPLVALVEGAIVGTSELWAKEFATLRQFETGSWLGQAFQGRGIGTAMRRATLALGFDGMGATRALTGAWEDNAASIAVTRKLGYVEQGHRWDVREGVATQLLGFEMEREQYDRVRPSDVEFIGLDGVREFLEIEATTRVVGC
ncbi:MAG: GNAT family N-acetyltransferase [Actinomycetota bacterium]